MGRSVLSPPVANIPDFDAKLLSDLAGRLAAVTPMVHYRTLKLLGITFPRFAPFGATVLIHNSLVSDPTNRVQFFGGRAHTPSGELPTFRHVRFPGTCCHENPRARR